MSTIKRNWFEGKISDIPLKPPHDRGVFCVDINSTNIVTGSADHGLRVWDLKTGKYCRELYGKRYGHHEWVTTVAYLNNGKCISGAMDGMLCLWEKNIVKCDTLKGHKTSVSKLKVDQNNICISSSYDCTLNLWDLDNTLKSDKLYGPHKNAVMDFAWNNSLVVSGDKDGVVAFWDINSMDSFRKLKAHGGPVTSIDFYSDDVNTHLISTVGGKDGILCVHDMRSDKVAYKQQIHGGAINKVATNMSGLIITCSADKTCCLIDPQSGFKEVGRLQCNDAAFTFCTAWGYTAVGCGDGNLLVFDNDSCKVLWGFGVMNLGAVHAMKVSDDCSRLVCVGDDPTSLLMNFT